MIKKDIIPQTEPTAPAVYDGPTGLADNITAKDLRLPRIALLQALSPLVQNEGEKYKSGMFIDTLTQDVLPSPLSFTPVFVFTNVIKWKPRTEGGGMIYKTTKMTDKVLRDIQWNGREKPTADQYINVVCMVPGIDVPLILSFCKTSLKAGQTLTTLIQRSGCAWKFNYILDAVKTTNTKGTFYVMRARRGDLSTPAIMQEAALLYNQVKGMSIDTDYEGATHEDVPATDAQPSEF